MSFEQSSGAIIYRKEGDKVYYLLLYYPSSINSDRGYWEFSKGHVEAGETDQETAVREIQEETGLRDLVFDSSFKKIIKYFFRIENKNVFKMVSFFLAQTQTEKIILSDEHSDFKWAEFDEAIKHLKFKNSKQLLTAANDFLKK